MYMCTCMYVCLCAVRLAASYHLGAREQCVNLLAHFKMGYCILSYYSVDDLTAYPSQVVVRSREFRRENRERSVRQYFYGTKQNTLFPFSFEVEFSDVQIYKVGGNAL